MMLRNNPSAGVLSLWQVGGVVECSFHFITPPSCCIAMALSKTVANFRF